MFEIPMAGALGVAAIIFYGLSVFAILLITYISAKFFRKFLDGYISKYGSQQQQQLRFFKHLLVGFVYVLGFAIAVLKVPVLGALAGTVLAGSGVVALVIGFASQQAVSNMVSGFLIALFRPFSVGDRLKVGKDLEGYVEDITLRHTIIKTCENTRVIIPNSLMTNQVIENENLIDEKIWKKITFIVHQKANIDTAMSIISEEAMRHPSFIDNRTSEERKKNESAVKIKVVSVTAGGIHISAWIWAKNSDTAFDLACDLYKSIKERFDKEGVELAGK